MAKNLIARAAIDTLFISNSLPPPDSEFFEEFLIHLEVLKDKTTEVNCMAVNKNGNRCTTSLDRHEACVAAIQLWSDTIDSAVSDTALSERIPDLAKNFLCRGRHRTKEGEKDTLAEKWRPLVRRARYAYVDQLQLTAVMQSSQAAYDLEKIQHDALVYKTQRDNEAEMLRQELQKRMCELGRAQNEMEEIESERKRIRDQVQQDEVEAGRTIRKLKQEIEALREENKQLKEDRSVNDQIKKECSTYVKVEPVE